MSPNSRVIRPAFRNGGGREVQAFAGGYRIRHPSGIRLKKRAQARPVAIGRDERRKEMSKSPIDKNEKHDLTGRSDADFKVAFCALSNR